MKWLKVKIKRLKFVFQVFNSVFEKVCFSLYFVLLNFNTVIANFKYLQLCQIIYFILHIILINIPTTQDNKSFFISFIV